MKITEAGFSSTETADRNVPLNWTAQNTSVTELSKDRQHHRDRQHTAYQTWALRFLERAQEPIFASHTPGPLYFFERAAHGRKEPCLKKSTHVSNVQLFGSEMHSLQNTLVKQHAFWVETLDV